MRPSAGEHRPWSRLFFGLALSVALSLPIPGGLAADADAQRLEAVVMRVVDPTTLSVFTDSGPETVRCIGIAGLDPTDPKRSSIEVEALEFARRLLSGKRVGLELDTEERDAANRLLAYVWVERFGVEMLFNAELLRQGHARVTTSPPNLRHQDLLIGAEQEARANALGIWAPDMPMRGPGRR